MPEFEPRVSGEGRGEMADIIEGLKEKGQSGHSADT